MSDQKETTHIECRILLSEIQEYGPTQRRQEEKLNAKLRAAGIPMKGMFAFDGVSRGTLVINTDFGRREMVFIWDATKEP